MTTGGSLPLRRPGVYAATARLQALLDGIVKGAPQGQFVDDHRRKGGQMFSSDADLFFESPRTEPRPPGQFGILHLLRRDIDQCMSTKALWPAAMLVLAGVDLLGKFFAGNDASGVGERFDAFLKQYFTMTNPADRNVIYHLRNSLLHSFGLYSQDRAGKKYYFVVTPSETGPLVSSAPQDRYIVHLPVLHHEFENAVEAYRKEVDGDPQLQANFTAMFPNYGSIRVG